MAIAFANLGASAAPDTSGTNTATLTTASWAPPTSGLIIVFVAGRNAAGSNQPTISGNGLTWTAIKTVTTATVHRLTLFGANASGATTGATSISFGGQTQVYAIASFFHATGVDLSGGVAAAFVQSPTNTGNNVQSLSITLAAAGHADNRPIAGFYHAANSEATTPRTNWTEADDLTGNSGRALETQYRTDAFETTASASWASAVVCHGIAAELKATVAAGGTDTLSAAGTTSATSLAAAALGQVHIFSAAGVTSAPTLPSAVLGQKHVLGASGLSAASSLTGVTLGQKHALSAGGLTSAPTLPGAAVGQVHALSAIGLEAQADIALVALGTSAEVYALEATGFTAAASIGSVALGQIHTLSAAGPTSGATLPGAALGQAHAFTAAPLTAAPSIAAVALGQIHALDTDTLTAAAELSAGTLAQIQVLDAAGLLSETMLSAGVLNWAAPTTPDTRRERVAAQGRVETAAAASRAGAAGRTGREVVAAERRRVSAASESRRIEE